MTDITIKNLTKQFHNETVINDFSYTFKKGNTYCIMGQSGIGKTTLMRIITGLEKASDGIVEYDGNFSVVFQENRLIENLSAVANVKMVLSCKEENKISEELTKMLPINSIYKKCNELSGGMKRKVAIIRAMMYSSDYIFMDEPFTGLDDESKMAAMEYIVNNKNGRTLIIITHNQEDANYLNAEICVLTRE